MKKYIKIIALSVTVIAIFVASFFLGETEKTDDNKNIYVTEEIKEERPVIKKEEFPSVEKTQEKTPQKSGETQEEFITELDKKETISLLVECSDLLTNIESLKEEKRSLVPGNGIIFSRNNIKIEENESAFDVLKRELINAGIHIEFILAPVYNSVYIEGINNIYEFDCGERSGWKYSVNGKYPPVASSEYKVKANDKIVFTYRRIAY